VDVSPPSTDTELVGGMMLAGYGFPLFVLPFGLIFYLARRRRMPAKGNVWRWYWYLWALWAVGLLAWLVKVLVS
jgi:hypothetical protein